MNVTSLTVVISVGKYNNLFFSIFSLRRLCSFSTNEGLYLVLRESEFLKWFIMPNEILDKNEETVEKWTEVFDLFQKDENSVNVVMATCSIMTHSGWFGTKPEKKLSVKDLWNETENSLILYYIPAFMLTYTAEFVNIIDSVFLVGYCWNKWYGKTMIALYTLLDADRIVTVWYTHQWCKGGK